MKIIFATHNQNKVEELKQIVPLKYSLLSLNDIGCIKEIKETGSTLEENAKIKADYVRYKYGLDCFSDDSGLEIDALGGAPGVYSARYAGDQKNNDANIEKIWKELKGIRNPKAIFRSVIYVHLNKKKICFQGKVEGSIIYEKRGLEGFGYDPIFIPKGYKKTFAELGDTTKNKISHRALAIVQLVKLLERT
ncbi:MAG: non-canonical purine NTP diphosphatase [Flavobacteriaceae bacterium]